MKIKQPRRLRLYSITLILLLCTALPASPQTRKAKPRGGAQPVPSAPAPVAELTTAQLPAGYTGANAVNIFQTIYAARPQFRKSEFETTPQYEDKVARAASRLPGVTSRVTVLLPDTNFNYDADAGVFLVKAEEQSLPIAAPFAGNTDERIFENHLSFILNSTTKGLGSFVGRNLFGVKKRVAVTKTTSLRLAVPTESVDALIRGLLVPVAPAEARVMSTRLRLAVTGSVVEPYGGENTGEDDATMSEPKQEHYSRFYVFFRPDAAIVYDIQTGVVYGGVDLTAPLPKINILEKDKIRPIKVEGPSEWQRREQEKGKMSPE